MTKPIHPIRKLLAALDLHNAATTRSPNNYQRAVARHVKPLLDALDVAHEVEMALGEEEHPPAGVCDVCNLLAAWRANL